MNDSPQTQFNVEGQPAFPIANTETENSTESSTEETTTEPTQTPEGEENTGETTQDGETTEDPKPKPLHEEPRWKEREDDWKERFNEQETRHSGEIQKLREEFDGKIDKSKTDHTPSTEEIPDWFEGDEKSWAKFLTWNDERINKARETIQTGISEKSAAEQKLQQDATDFMNAEVGSIENDKTLNPDGLKIDRNKLFKFVYDEKLVDTSGRWNYRAGWRLMQAGVKSTKNATIQEKKEIAGASTAGGGQAEPEKSNHATSEDFQNPANRPW